MKFNVIKKADEHEFLPILAEIEEEPTSPLGRIILWFVLMIIVLAVIGLFVAKIDVVVSGRGLIIPEGEIKIVQPLEGGVISKINVKVGSYVKEGEVLMEIDPSVIDPDFNSKKENLERIGKEISFINDLLAGKKTVNRDPELGKYISMRENMLGQIDSKRAQISQLNEQTKSLRKELETTDELLAGEKTRLEKLELVKDIISYDDYKKSYDSVLTLQKEVSNIKYSIEGVKHQIEQLNKEIEVVRGSTVESWQKELSDLRKTYSTLKAEVDQAAFRHGKQQILSPVEGHVNTIMVHTVGGVVTPAQELISIVPVNNALLAKVQILNKDIGYIGDEQNCVIKMDTYDFQKYGMINGKVLHISPDSIENEQLGRVYEVYIVPDNLTLSVEGRTAPITSGMSLTAEIKVGKRRVIEFFIYPAIKYLDEGLKVR